ncbi:2290_t:CDS:2 [Acaulospora colombiana]|uniref:2290_t:CDS:1 n=1 Tax=Acaulospora colombiana TaxID=27376 RepID=A0ACA9LH68_9GLOM|nr:2290_t:CDS:2 [Acaulospora colombiana]
MSKGVKPYLVPLKPDRILLNPKFEGYKLKLFEDRTQLCRFLLPSPGISTSKVSTKSKLSYKEIQNRIHFNHLFSGYETNDGKKVCFYFDRELSISMIEYDPITSSIATHSLLKIPKSLDDDTTAEHPSLKALSSTLLLATNGLGTMLLVRIAKSESNEYQGEVVYCTEFKIQPSVKRTPCVIIDAKVVGEAILFLVYNTTKAQEVSTTQKSSRDGFKKTTFDVTLMQMSVMPPHDLQVIHVVRGEEIPLYCSIESSGDGYVIGGRVDYEVVCEASTKEGVDQMDIDQSTDTLRYVSNFHRALLRQISNKEQPLPRYAFTQLFDLIDPDASLWTIEPNIGLLTLHIEKGHQGTRWSHVFQNDDGVHETLDPNEFAEFRERLEKYTGDLLDDDNDSSDFPGRKSLLQHPIGYEMEESIDYEGSEFTLVRMSIEGKITAKTSGGHEFLCRQFESCDINNSTPFMPSVCLKYDVDGLVYSVGHPNDYKTHDVSPFTMTHVATFNAFAFVQASKREKRYMFHDPLNRFVMIFDESHHAFVYWHHANREKNDEQFVIDFADNKNNDIDIVGVQMVDSNGAVILVLIPDSVIMMKLL